MPWDDFERRSVRTQGRTLPPDGVAQVLFGTSFHGGVSLSFSLGERGELEIRAATPPDGRLALVERVILPDAVAIAAADALAAVSSERAPAPPYDVLDGAISVAWVRRADRVDVYDAHFGCIPPEDPVTQVATVLFALAGAARSSQAHDVIDLARRYVG